MILEQQGHNGASTPWYAKKTKPNLKLMREGKDLSTPVDYFFDLFKDFKKFLSLFYPSLFIILSALLFGVFLTLSFFYWEKTYLAWTFLIFSFVFVCLCLYFTMFQIGKICIFFNEKESNFGYFVVGLRYLKSEIERDDLRKKLIPAPEMALNQFLQQVRAYSFEKSYSKNKNEKQENVLNLYGIDPSSLLKRRWNDVLDSLNEFEIYLANDPQGMIEKLVSKSPLQSLDVSQIFRDVAETFDATWRRKGINIESAIVTPLKANTNESLLRRLLVGPWRTCVHLVKKGNSVIFSAKSIDGKIHTYWECEGVILPEEFLETIATTSLSVNERVERALAMISEGGTSPNALFAMISFVTWFDLAKEAQIEFKLRQGNDGLIFELKI